MHNEIPHIYPLGHAARPGDIPKLMWASCLRRERYGEPAKAFQVEQLPTPAELEADEVLVYVMAAATNYNGIWAASGKPLDLIKHGRLYKEHYDYFIAGSEASGVVWKTGADVRDLQVGDHVVISPMCWNGGDPIIRAGGDPRQSPSYRVWGYEKNIGAFAQFTRVNAGQCIKKPAELSWAQAAGALGGIAFCHKMLLDQRGAELLPGDPVLIWGGAGNVGQSTIEICNYVGARAIAVVSSPERAAYCKALGAHGVIDRTEFNHWGKLPDDFSETGPYRSWLKEAKRFAKTFYAALGEKTAPRFVIEHPGENTIPTSIFMCAQNGMVVTCGGTTGYYGSLDLRYLWLRGIRFQGSHGFDRFDHAVALELWRKGEVALKINRSYQLDEVGLAHQVMKDNVAPAGNMVILIGAGDITETAFNGIAK